MEFEIIRVKTKDYKEFMDMINWRITGKRADQLREEGKLAPYTSYEIDCGNCLNTDYFFVYAARVDQVMVGYINASIIPKPDSRIGTLFIDELWTQPEFRNYGIAKALLRRVIELGRELKLWECRLTFDVTNLPAAKIYREVGFSEKECLFGRLSLEIKDQHNE